MKNIGTKTWVPGGPTPYRLGSQNPRDNTTWGLRRVALPHEVAPGSEVSFDFTVTAPSASGVVDFQWGMLQETVIKWFGGSATSRPIRKSVSETL